MGEREGRGRIVLRGDRGVGLVGLVVVWLRIKEFRAFVDVLTTEDMEEIVEVLRAQVGAKVKRKKKK